MTVKLFPWEDLNAVAATKKAFGLTNGAAQKLKIKKAPKAVLA
jgi:hypothetical protein